VGYVEVLGTFRCRWNSDFLASRSLYKLHNSVAMERWLWKTTESMVKIANEALEIGELSGIKVLARGKML